MVAHATALKGKVGARWREGGGQTGSSPKRRNVISRPVRFGTGQTVPADDGVHESRVAIPEGSGAETNSLQRRQADVGEKDVGLIDQRVGDLAALGRGEIEDNASLGAIVELEDRVAVEVSSEHLLEAAGGVAARGLDLHDVGSPVAQNASDGRTGDPYAQLDHLHAPEWPGRFVCSVHGSPGWLDTSDPSFRPGTSLRFLTLAEASAATGPW